MNEQWAIVELMGHVRIAGRLSEEEKFGSKLGRLDIPQPDGSFVTQHFGGGSVYRITYVGEAEARAVAAANRPEPVHSWEMPRALPPHHVVHTTPEEEEFEEDPSGLDDDPEDTPVCPTRPEIETDANGNPIPF